MALFDERLQRLQAFAESLQNTIEMLKEPGAANDAETVRYLAGIDQAIRRFEGTTHPNRRTAENDRARHFFAVCEGFAPGPMRDQAMALRLADAAIMYFETGYPEEGAKLKKQRKLVAKYLTALHLNLGGSGNRVAIGNSLSEIRDQICKAVEWKPMTDEAAKKAKQRRNKKPVPT